MNLVKLPACSAPISRDPLLGPKVGSKVGSKRIKQMIYCFSTTYFLMINHSHKTSQMTFDLNTSK